MFPQILLDPLLTKAGQREGFGICRAFVVAIARLPAKKKGPPPSGSRQVLECQGINPARINERPMGWLQKAHEARLYDFSQAAGFEAVRRALYSIK